MEQAGHPLNTYRYVPSSTESRTRENIWFQGCYTELPVSGQSWNAFMYKWEHTCICSFHMQFACAFKWRCMQPHLLHLKKTIFTIHSESLSSWVLEDWKQLHPNIWPRLDISSLHELLLTPFKMSQRGNPWWTCEWLRMKENWSTVLHQTLYQDTDRCD